MDDDNKKDGRGHAPGSVSTQIKKGEKKNPNGRPKGAKGVVATMRKAFLQKADWLGDGNKTYIEAMVEGGTKHVFKGNHHHFDLVLEMLIHVSRIEQVRENSAAEREHRKNLDEFVRVYEAHENRLLELTDDEFAGLVKLVKDKLRQTRGGPLKPIDEIAVDILAESKLKKG